MNGKHMTEEELKDVRGGTRIVISVEWGDTLGKLAEKFHCTVEDICKWNNIEDPNKIQEGQKLEFRF